MRLTADTVRVRPKPSLESTRAGGSARTPGIVEPLVAAAQHSELLLFGAVVPSAKKKVLLGRHRVDSDAQRATRLRLVHADEDWELYQKERMMVEQAYGVSPAEVAQLVRHMRQCTLEHPMRWFFYQVDDCAVGAVGLYEFALDGAVYCRLQDVDVFPRFRAQGHGNGLLDDALAQAATQGARAVVVGADEDDWPLGWYIRRGFSPLASVHKASHSALSRKDA